MLGRPAVLLYRLGFPAPILAAATTLARRRRGPRLFHMPLAPESAPSAAVAAAAVIAAQDRGHDPAPLLRRLLDGGGDDPAAVVAAADAAGLDGALLLCEAFEAAAQETLAANRRQVAALNLATLPALILNGTPLVGGDAILRAAGAPQ